MPHAVALTHVAFEDVGLFGLVLDEHGLSLSTYPAWDRPQDAGAADLLIILGGPISVNATDDYPFLEWEIALAKDRITEGKPTIGICLGAQIMAKAVGGNVGPGTRPEIGWAPVKVTPEGRDSVLVPLTNTPVLHWHGEVCHLPKGIDSLAETEACATQAFMPGPKALALQFHVEAGAAGIEPWLVGHTLEIAKTAGVDVQSLRRDTDRFGPGVETAGQEMFRRWLSAVGLNPV